MDIICFVKKPTSWYKPQCGSAKLKPPARFYTEYSPLAGQKMPATTLANSSRRKRLTVYSPTAGQKSFLEKKEQTKSYYKMNTKNSSSQP
ncbi:hypothetical protein Taro_039699 [Colocasia esculenta]|uniref:Uncharacterized protein n=1 Tax=Colocasia esculenta TaxID=4460 RepID=A0A843WH91_COLES|nr:hypothetical protein [Colocasia esculenta]